MLPGNHRFKSLNIDMVCWTRTKAILRWVTSLLAWPWQSWFKAIWQSTYTYTILVVVGILILNSIDPLQTIMLKINIYCTSFYLCPQKKNITPKLHQCLIGMYSIWVGEACVISITHRKYERRIALTWWIQSPESIITIMVEKRECNYQSVII